jgi:beta-galactosidase
MTDKGDPERPRWPARPRGIAYGGDYNPEQWPEDVWREDVALMRTAGVNLVTVGVFAWARLQPGPDRWDFGWLDRVLDLLAENGIAVDLATATASPPPWFAVAHPDALPQTADGRRFSIGSRQHFCPSSPAYADAASALVYKLASRYRDHPALALWHIGNEYGDHVEACYCDVSAEHFRRWLQQRYGTLDALNDAWTTDVWSGRYGDWREVMPPRLAPGPINPALQLDFRRFSSDALLACFDRERDILRELSPSIPVTTNFMRLFKGIDHWRWSAHEDLVSCDLYPEEPGGEVETALNGDLMRSLGDGRPWLLMEQAPGAVSWRRVNMPKRQGVMRARSYQAVARGADGVLFFQWRSSRGGPEAFHSAMLPPGGTAAAGWGDIVQLGRELRALEGVRGSRCVSADTALLLDWESWWALEQEGHPSSELSLPALVLAAYRPLWEANITVDFRHPRHDLSRYRLIVAPNLFLLDERAAKNLRGAAAAGAILVIGPFSGIVDPRYQVPEGAHPGLLRDVLGLIVEEYWPIEDGQVGVIFESGERCYASLWRERILVTSAEVLAAYEDGDLAGAPAVTLHRIGSGEAWHLGTVPDPHGMKLILHRAAVRAGVRPVAHVPKGVEACLRTDSTFEYLFLINHGDRPATIATGVPSHELLSDRAIESLLTLEPRGVAVLRRMRSTQ